MKKCLCFFLGMLVFILAGCSPADDGWKTVSVKGCGTWEIPLEWDFYTEDGLVYIVGADSKPIAIQTRSYSGIEDGQPGDTESHAFFGEITNLKTLSSAVISNGAIYGQVLMKKGDTTTQNHYVDMGYDVRILLVFWDETIEEDTVRKIAESFVSG